MDKRKVIVISVISLVLLIAIIIFIRIKGGPSGYTIDEDCPCYGCTNNSKKALEEGSYTPPPGGGGLGSLGIIPVPSGNNIDLIAETGSKVGC